MKLKDQNPALILIDIQKTFLDEDYWGGNRNNITAENVCGRILSEWRKFNLPIFHIRHTSPNASSVFHPSGEGYQFLEGVQPGKDEIVITKNVNSAFIGTDLQEQLDKQKIDHLIIVGLTTDHCVSTTTRMAGNLGYKTYVISDATATFDRNGVNGERYESRLIHSTALASLNNEFATVWNSEELFRVL